MTIHGYMIDVEFDGQTLTLHATNKAAQAALVGPKSLAKLADAEAERKGIDAAPLVHDGDVVIPRGDIAGVEFKEASRLTNGRLTVHTRSGRQYIAHFRRKSGDEFAELRAALA